MLFETGFLRGLLTRSVLKFVTETFHLPNHGSFRVRLKLHKEWDAADAIPARPICSMGKSWCANASAWIKSQLSEAVTMLPHKLACSNQLQYFLNRRDFSDCQLFTGDIHNLYPSVPITADSDCHFMIQFSASVRRYLTHSRGSLVIEVVKNLVLNQHVTYRDTLFTAAGVATGSSSGVHLTEMYHAEFDLYLQSSLQGIMRFFKRYVDDSLIISTGTSHNRVLDTMNAWHPNIVWTDTCKPFDTTVTFLDANIHLNPSGAIEFTTYRKPMNLYLYCPSQSCHPPNIAPSIVHSEVARMRRTNTSHKEFLFQARYFQSKFNGGGHRCTTLVDALLDRERRRRHSSITHVKAKQPRRFNFALPYSFSLRTSTFQKAFRSHSGLIHVALKGKALVSLALQLQQNLHKRMHKHTWAWRDDAPSSPGGMVEPHDAAQGEN